MNIGDHFSTHPYLLIVRQDDHTFCKCAGFPVTRNFELAIDLDFVKFDDPYPFDQRPNEVIFCLNSYDSDECTVVTLSEPISAKSHTTDGLMSLFDEILDYCQHNSPLVLKTLN